MKNNLAQWLNNVYTKFQGQPGRDGRYQNFPLSIIVRLNTTIMAIIAIPTAMLGFVECG